MQYTNITNPVFLTPEGDLISCLVFFDGYGEFPFVASSHDPEEWGREIYQSLMAGEWGEIAPYSSDEEEINQEEILAHKKKVISYYLDSKAQEYGYDSINTAVTYANEPSVPKFQQEGIAFRQWRSQVWAFGYELLSQVLAKQRDIPSDEELINLLPILEMTDETNAH